MTRACVARSAGCHIPARWTGRGLGSDDAMLIAVVVATGRDPDLVANDLVDESVLVGDTPRPETLEVAQQLGLPDSLVAVARDVSNERVDPFQDLPILCLPP